MVYDFSEFFKDEKDSLLDEFLDKCTSHINLDENVYNILIERYKDIFNIFGRSFEKKEILILFENLAKYETLLDYPYIIIINEVFSLKSILINKITSIHKNSGIFEFLSLFNEINNKIAKIYLDGYIKNILSLNNMRINSMADLINKNITKHYESHLVWLTNIAIFISSKEQNIFPELDATKCDFGKWLHNEAKNIIQNNSKFKTISSLHNSLHLFGNKIKNHTIKNDYHIIITYLEKCELLSLGIGTELALIDNILMNKEITKDALTGAMNRNGLKSVFESQYELSLATNNSFVLAMCDLDYFKKVNDNHGHIAGDEMLILFVNVVKKFIRNSDIIIRYGGEEFIIILPAVAKADAHTVLEKIRKAFENSFITKDSKKITTTVSIGLVGIKPEYYYKNQFLNEYVNIADQRLYMAKENGRNRIELY